MPSLYRPSDPDHLRRATIGEELISERTVDDEPLSARSSVLDDMHAIAAAAVRDILHSQAARYDFDIDLVVGNLGALLASAMASFIDDLVTADETGELSRSHLLVELSDALNSSLNDL
jgi:hypothetical protein